MRFGVDLREKAFLALEEAVQECRFARVRQTYALRFALAYLWSLRRGDRGCYGNFWTALVGDNDLHRFGNADRALTEIYRQLGMERPEAPGWQMWHEAQARHRREQSIGDQGGP